jgi:hypothetical protein
VSEKRRFGRPPLLPYQRVSRLVSFSMPGGKILHFSLKTRTRRSIFMKRASSAPTVLLTDGAASISSSQAISFACCSGESFWLGAVAILRQSGR